MRRRRPEKREILPDPVYGDLIVAKFIWMPWIEHLNSLPEPKISYEKRYLITDDDEYNILLYVCFCC